MASKQAGKAQIEEARLLTAEDIFSGGEDPYQPLELPNIKKGGGPGIVYLKPLSAGSVLDFMDAPAEENNKLVLTLISEAVCDREGNALFDEASAERLRDISMTTFKILSDAVTKMANMGADDAEKGAPEGNDSSEAPGGDSPTD